LAEAPNWDNSSNFNVGVSRASAPDDIDVHETFLPGSALDAKISMIGRILSGA
jgi:hypothetical protein